MEKFVVIVAILAIATVLSYGIHEGYKTNIVQIDALSHANCEQAVIISGADITNRLMICKMSEAQKASQTKKE
jgi:hypothetical protein